MAIKKLQNDFTTPEQSKRLLELGVPVDSANCSIDEWGRVHKIPQDNGNLLFSQLKRQTIYTIRPCWSVGRLVEICLKCSTLEQRQVRFFCNGDDDEYSLIDYVVNALESGVTTNHMDFSKLEE